MKPETLELILSIAEYVVSFLLGYAGAKWKPLLVFFADLLPILRRVLPPVYNAPTNPRDTPELRWPSESANYSAQGFAKKPVSGAWIV